MLRVTHVSCFHLIAGSTGKGDANAPQVSTMKYTLFPRFSLVKFSISIYVIYASISLLYTFVIVYYAFTSSSSIIELCLWAMYPTAMLMIGSEKMMVTTTLVLARFVIGYVMCVNARYSHSY